jgi:hypothetical protein
MKTNKLIPICISLTALLPGMGCKTHTPMVRNHEGVYQYKAEAAEHWREMANDMADKLCRRLSSQTGLPGSAVFIEPPKPDASEFDLAYYRMLKVQLLDQGWKLVDQPAAALVNISFQTQLVSHGDRRYWEDPTTLFGALGLNATTPFGAFGYEVVHFFTGDNTGSDRKTSKDLIVTAFVRTNGVPLFGHIQIVYVPAGDAPLYMARGFSFGADWDQLTGNP